MTTLRELATSLPCGCRVWKQIVDGERQFVMDACSPDCKYVQYTRDLAREQGKPVLTKVKP